MATTTTVRITPRMIHSAALPDDPPAPDGPADVPVPGTSLAFAAAVQPLRSVRGGGTNDGAGKTSPPPEALAPVADAPATGFIFGGGGGVRADRPAPGS